MALEEVAVGISEVASVAPVEEVLNLIFLAKALGFAAIAYILYALVMAFLTYRRIKKVEQIEKKADSIGKKLNDVDKKLNDVDKKLNKLIRKF